MRILNSNQKLFKVTLAEQRVFSLFELRLATIYIASEHADPAIGGTEALRDRLDQLLLDYLSHSTVRIDTQPSAYVKSFRGSSIKSTMNEYDYTLEATSIGRELEQINADVEFNDVVPGIEVNKSKNLSFLASRITSPGNWLPTPSGKLLARGVVFPEILRATYLGAFLFR